MMNKQVVHNRLLIVALLVYQAAYFTVVFQSKGANIDAVERHTLSTDGFFNPMTSSMMKLFYGNNDEISLSLCRNIDAMSSFQLVWEKKKESILKVSLVSTNETENIRSNQNFTNWVEESMLYFTYSRLQHSIISRPMDQSRSIGRIHTILEQKLVSPHKAPPLRIVVFGGSVTMGHHCIDNIFDYPVIHGRPRIIKECPWPARLQDMIDEILGVGVVEIRNMAVGGASTDMATAVMEFGLISGSTPDIIVWDHGINDNKMHIDSKQRFALLQEFYQATTALPRPCDYPDPPLVIFLDSYLGGFWSRVSDGLRSAMAISNIATWYPDIWVISFANIVRPYVLSNDQHKMLKLLGSDGVTMHPGMMYHISIAWTILFNFLLVLHDNCTAREHLNNTYSSERIQDYFKLSSLPALDDNLHTDDVPRRWAERTPELQEEKECLDKQAEMIEVRKNFTKHSSSTCFYVWMVNRLLKIEYPKDIVNVMQPYLKQNKGWMAFQVNEGDKLGWQTSGGQGSYFELQFDNVPPKMNTLTIVYMQSYSQKWYNSTLEIDISFIEPLDEDKNITNRNVRSATSPSNTTAISSDAAFGSIQPFTIKHTLIGYHEEESSVQVPTKLALPNRTLGDSNSTLRLHFHLVNGETFKIMGIAIC